ncbi:zinc-dependent metalloprotease [Ferrimonas sp. SCSIO 43195]|uniref:zinc-dependent metalloprotease n=1 Tax=Ferrimonas sp. SCSIO 43195 TaxID=2822844 RepID=UPI002075DE1B|nr:zinc-dependent metalloprotease [Ferrimonas sp. SCSIO 43195]USD38411.1 zinc-dependent metalloprotease [Ferrimonas sp. SCSIO 43195]
MFKRIAIAVAISAALAGCGTEERPYDVYERPAEEITTASLDTESLWLFMPSTGAAPRYAMTQRGFFQGDAKLVTLRFDEFNGIYAEEVDRDKLSMDSESRWDADINKAPVLKIPGEFREYRCALNAYDECTNKEEINLDEDRKWTDATHFVPDYEGIQALAQDSLTWYTSSNVEETASARIVSYEYKPEEGMINVEVERTFTADPEDQYQFGYDLNNLSFKTRFFYSLVKLDKLITPDYQPVYYQGRDRSYYGFFNDSKEQRTATGEQDVQGSVYSLLNRFAPSKSSIDYYLSDSYHEGGNELYKRVTMESITDINKSLEGTGVPPIRIVNPNSKAGIHTGDLRYNVLNLITDPVDNGLLGYGPSATNPLTGEIVHAHVNQYAGVIRSATRSVWTQLVMRYNRQEIVRPDEYKPEPETSEGGTDTSATTPEIVAPKIGDDVVVRSVSTDEIEQLLNRGDDHGLHLHEHKHDWNTANPDLATQSFNKHQKRLQMLSEQNAFSVEFMWLSTQQKGLIKGINYLEGGYFANEENTELKTWDDLTSAQQTEVSDAIAEHMFRSTLIHELGHNLGLRHNFMGSVDKANFYSEEEAKAKGMDKVPAYSSIMDYAGSVFDELPTYGKYDIATLRFGYGRQVETELATTVDNEETGLPEVKTEKKYLSVADLDANLAKDFNAYPTGIVQHMRDNYMETDQVKDLELGDNQTLKLAQFNYCTDEHTTTSVLCNRFDEGTDINEITKFRIQRYHDSYDTMNKRNGRQSFHQFHQYNYFLSRWDQFLQIRDVIENVEEIDYLFARYLGISEERNSQGQSMKQIYNASCRWKDYDTLSPGLKNLCTTYEASRTAAQFFIDVMTETDKVCEIEEIATGVENRVTFRTLSDLWKDYRGHPAVSKNRDIPTSCFDPELVTALEGESNPIKVRSETKDGRIEASLQANNPHQSSVTSVDLLGTWPDKLLAAQMLVRRDSPYVDTENSSLALLDIDYDSRESYAQLIYNHLSYLTGSEQFNPPKFVDKDGKTVETVQRYVPKLTKLMDNSPSYLWPMKRFFRLTAGDELQHWFDPSMPDVPTPAFNALLKNLSDYGRMPGLGINDSAEHLVDSLGIYQVSPYIDTTNAITFSWKAKKYVIIPRRNELANAMARRALYGELEPQEQYLNDGLPSELETAMRTMFKDTQSTAEASVVAVGDSEALTALKEDGLDAITGRTTWTGAVITPARFQSYKENGSTCYRVLVDGESDEQRLTRKCNTNGGLRLASAAMDNLADDRVTMLSQWSGVYGGNLAFCRADDKLKNYIDVFDYEPEVLHLWATKKYEALRPAFLQLPVLNP